jgi:transcription elongation factor Elf1
MKCPKCGNEWWVRTTASFAPEYKPDTMLCTWCGHVVECGHEEKVKP